MRKRIEWWLSRTLALSALALITWVLARPMAAELGYTLDPLRVYQNMQNLGNNCVSSFDSYEAGATIDSLWQLHREPKPMLVPFRRDPRYKRPTPDKYVYVSCNFSLPGIPDQGRQRFLSLGRIFGAAEVRLNSRLVWKQEKVEMPIIAVPDSELPGNATLEIIATAKEGPMGPSSLLPLVFTSDVNDIRAISQSLMYNNSSHGLPGVGISFAFSMLFFICYWRGIRYRDVLWALIAFSAYGALVGLTFSLTGERTAFADALVDQLSWFTHMATGATIYAFLRLPASNLKILAVVLGVCLLNNLRMSLPVDIRNIFGFYTRNDPYYFAAGFTFLLAAILRHSKSEMPLRRLFQMRVLTALVATGIVAWIISGIVALRTGIDFSIYVLFVILVAYGLFLSIDLVVYHRAYFTEKALKESESRQRFQLEERLELGDRIQKMLMPADFHPHIGSWKIDILYESAELMAGDWLTYFRRDRTIWALCGDVVGKGPQAAIATSSLLTTLYNSSEESSSLADVIKRTDRSLSKIFKTSMVSTVAAAELLNEGTARLMAHGFMGWILLPVKGKARQIPGRGSSLGSGLISDIIFHEEQLAPGDRLLVFSDGVADGSRASHKIIKSLDGKCGQMTANEIMAAVVNIGRSSVTVDDKTMMILTYLP